MAAIKLKDLPPLQRRPARNERDAKRRQLSEGRFKNLVDDIVTVINLAYEARAIDSLFGFEGPLRHSIRSDLCLQHWSWRDADSMARDVLKEVFIILRAVRPTYEEGQQNWTIPNNIIMERTRCLRCGSALPEGHFKFCGRLCGDAHRHQITRLLAANEDVGLTMAIRSI